LFSRSGKSRLPVTSVTLWPRSAVSPCRVFGRRPPLSSSPRRSCDEVVSSPKTSPAGLAERGGILSGATGPGEGLGGGGFGCGRVNSRPLDARGPPGSRLRVHSQLLRR
jgi:hypothetical protein